MSNAVSAARPALHLPGQGAGEHTVSVSHRKPAGGRIPMLDGLRLLAALSVLAYHYIGITGGSDIWRGDVEKLVPGVQAIAQYGYLGVEFFFLISGFVICMSSWGKRPKDFFVSRVSRLFPAYWFAVLFTVAVVLFLPSRWPAHRPDITVSQVITNMTMAPGALKTQPVAEVCWTLWVEARFYLLIGALMVLGLTYQRVLAFCGVWLMAGLLAVELQQPVIDEIVMPRYAGLFVAGIAVYLMRRYGQNLVLWGLLGFAWFFELTLLHWRMTEPEASHHHKFSWPLSAGLLTFGLILLLLVAIGPLGRIQWRWLTTAGALTYPLYLLHQQFGLQLLSYLNWTFPASSRALNLAVVVAASLLIAYLVHRLVEKPASRLLRKGLVKGLQAARAEERRPVVG